MAEVKSLADLKAEIKDATGLLGSCSQLLSMIGRIEDQYDSIGADQSDLWSRADEIMTEIDAIATEAVAQVNEITFKFRHTVSAIGDGVTDFDIDVDDGGGQSVVTANGTDTTVFDFLSGFTNPHVNITGTDNGNNSINIEVASASGQTLTLSTTMAGTDETGSTGVIVTLVNTT